MCFTRLLAILRMSVCGLHNLKKLLWSSLVAQWVKDLALSMQRLGSPALVQVQSLAPELLHAMVGVARKLKTNKGTSVLVINSLDHIFIPLAHFALPCCLLCSLCHMLFCVFIVFVQFCFCIGALFLLLYLFHLFLEFLLTFFTFYLFIFLQVEGLGRIGAQVEGIEVLDFLFSVNFFLFFF